MAMTATKLRENVYQLLDQVAETGKPIEIERKGRLFVISSLGVPSKLSRLKKHKTINEEDMDSIVHMDWSSEWRPSL